MYVEQYQCEQLIALMTSNKSSDRSWLTDTHLYSILKVASSNKISPEIEQFVAKKYMSNITNSIDELLIFVIQRKINALFKKH